MIVRPREHWLRMLLVWNGSVLPTILPQLVLTLAISLVAVWGGGRVLGEKVPLNPTPFTLIGLTLAIFAGFRNNASYERYREGRQLWGGVLTATRTLVSQALCYGAVDRDDASRRAFVRTVVAFVYTLKHQLRGTDPAADLRGLLDGATYARVAASRFRPVVIVHALREALAARADAGQLADTRLWMLDARLDDLVAMVSGCERIASTPIPFSYDVLLHRTIYAYCVLLPFGLVDSIGAATPFVTVFVAYTLIALDAIAHAIAEPFGDGPNHLALDAMTRQIERTLLELNREPLPAEVTPGPSYRLT
ncbi:bestrophin, RFP-TM, chloride channel [Burkholderia cenocepacia]|uniref:bestrophin family protein n=1 Tax=Burkholderia cenocepacia TaxID=95486 RepID=UPI0003C44D7A|nr:bestrophin family ion channel [Burkholderia cenocepacia]ESS38963.1 putative membrane protein [Burkholderia cenocepacia KC-01]QND96860.1 bestrophin, RFP-TM, chloride channel [Burkholderia cenocepacia]